MKNSLTFALLIIVSFCSIAFGYFQKVRGDKLEFILKEKTKEYELSITAVQKEIEQWKTVALHNERVAIEASKTAGKIK